MSEREQFIHFLEQAMSRVRFLQGLDRMAQLGHLEGLVGFIDGGITALKENPSHDDP